MMNQFSTEATSVVFDRLTNRPDLYERAMELVRKTPANAPQELRSWVQGYIELSTSALGNDLAKELIEASLRNVRWGEIRLALQREAN
jgi:hypothetical protein